MKLSDRLAAAAKSGPAPTSEPASDVPEAQEPVREAEPPTVFPARRVDTSASLEWVTIGESKPEDERRLSVVDPDGDLDEDVDVVDDDVDVDLDGDLDDDGEELGDDLDNEYVDDDELDAVVAGPSVIAAPAVGKSSARVKYVDPLATIKRSVHQSLLDALGPTLYDAELDERELAVRVRQTLSQVIESEQALIGTAERLRITSEISDEILGHGPIEPFLRDPEVTEIMVNGADQIYVERDGRIHPVNAAFTNDNHLRHTIEKIVARIGRRIDESSPMVDARLPDGSRVNAVLPPVALDGPMLTIRKFAADPLDIHDLVDFGTLTAATANLLAACVHARLNVLISGGTGSGKTTTLNVLSSFVPTDERVVTIEDAAELQLRQEHVIRLESRPPNIEGRGEVTTRDLVRNALRMRPDRIIVGEVRDGAAIDMMQAMNTGHDGSLTTLHANSPRDALSRLETMVLMAGVELPQRAIREQAASAIDLIVHQSRLRDGTRRVTHISEVTGMESDIITLQDLFLFDYGAGVDGDGKYLGSLRATGVRPVFVHKLADAGIALPAGLFADTM
jgi:pilus assembly protein CpaF